MRYLKRSTVIRAFIKRGWAWNEKTSHSFLMSPDVNAGGRIFGQFEEGKLTLKLYDARLVGHSNVHVVSYWGPFRNMKELHKALDTIEKVYSETCRTYFPKRLEQI